MSRWRCAARSFRFALVAIATTMLLSGMAAFSSTAEAASTQGSGPASNYQFSVEPYAAAGTQQRSDFTYELQPGHTVLDQVVILNNSKSPETFEVYPEDATNVKGTGGFSFQQKDKVQNSMVGKWLAIGQTQFTIPVGKEVVDTFQLAVPLNAPPGDHVGGVVVQQIRAPAQPQSKEGVNLVLRFAVPVFVRVVGPMRPSMTIENVTVYHTSPLIPYLSGTPKVAVRFTVINTGNVILSPKTATVSISALLGGTIHSYTVHQRAGAQSRTNPLPAQILPGGQFVLTELWSGLPPFDPLTAHVNVSAVNPTSSVLISTGSSTTFWYFPWLLVLILVALIVGFLVWRRWRRNRRERGTGASSPTGNSPVSEQTEDDPVIEPVEEVGV